MNNLAIISEITDNINSLNEKIDTTDKNTAKAFSYLYSVVTTIQSELDKSSKDEDIGNISKKIIDIDLSNSSLIKKMDTLESNYTYTETSLNTKVNNIITINENLNNTIKILENKINLLENIINSYDKVSGDYIFVEKSIIKKSTFFERLKYAFSLIFKKKKFEDEINRIETKTKEINNEKEKIKKENEEKRIKEEEEKKKQARDKIKNILKKQI